MGMFDSIYFSCPNGCEKQIEVQSKVGDCILHTFSQDTVPTVIAEDIEGQAAYCEGCHSSFTIRADDDIPKTVTMFLR